MYSPAAALAWEFWARHRLGLSAVVALVLAFAAVCAVAPLQPEHALAHSMWFAIGLCYVIGVFAYGFEGRLETAESGFPVRLFLLPVRTRVLVGWPMVQGAAAAVLLWLGWDHFVLRPCGIETPAWVTAILAAGVAVSQAIVWLPFGLPWVRLFVAFAALLALVRAPVVLALIDDRFAEPEDANRVLIAVGASLLPLAFLVACAGVGRARRGDDPDLLRAWRSVRGLARPRREPPPFASAMAAQMWYEWRARGRGAVLSVAIILAALMATSALTERDPGKRTNFGVMLLLTPVLMAPLWSAYGGTADVTDRSMRMSAFAATRPLSDSAFVVAKVRAAGVAAVLAGVAALVAFAVWLLYTGGYRDLGHLWDAVVAKQGIPRAVAFCVLLAAGPVLVTWRTLVAGLWGGLTGRAWVPAVQSIAVCAVGLQLMYEWTMWGADAARRARVLELLPWAAGAVVVLKVLVAWWAVSVLRRRKELEAGTLAKLVGAWVTVVAAVFAAAVWLVPADAVPGYGLALGAVLFVPFARLALAPLVFAWNRHR